jgi:heavy metal translocating P-type ATPase
MLPTHSDPRQARPPESADLSLSEHAPAAVAPRPSRAAWSVRLWRAVKRYPLPLVALVLLLASLGLWLAGRSDLAEWMLLAIIVIGAGPLVWETLLQVLHREFGVDLIAILAISGSVLLKEYLAGAIIVLMLSGGEALEAFALRRARQSLAALAERAPRTAHLWQDDQLLTIPAEAVQVGMEVVVKPGELVPVDGLVTKGASSVSEADLTGEPVPVPKAAGHLCYAGSVNLDSVLEVRATKRSAESQYAQIIRLVEQAQQRKARIHRLADRYGVWFTLLALAIAATAWFLSGDSIYALAVLVVATPCPLILATPIAIMAGIDRAAQRGVIVKSGAALEQLGEVEVAVFDKTGTLTLGTPRLVEVLLTEEAKAQYAAETVLGLVASVEQLSTHILARATVEAAYERGLALWTPSEFEETLGKGIHGHVPGRAASDGEAHQTLEVTIGNRTYMRSLGVALPEALVAERERRTAEGQIVSFVALNRQVAGLFIFADVPRPDLARLSPALKAAGIEETVLLTGDSETVAGQIGKLAQVDRVVARCLPAQKVQVVEEYQGQRRQVLMVGDGINDAPALATATVGLAMGAQGLTAAATAADAVLLSPDIFQVVGAVRLGRQVMRVARQGIWVGIGLSIVAMIFAALGFIPPAAGAVLQEGVDVLVIINALRAGRTPRADRQGSARAAASVPAPLPGDRQA